MKKIEPIYNVDNKSEKLENNINNDKITTKVDFVSLYTKLYNENFEELEKLREKERKTGIIIFACIFGFVICGMLFPFLMPLLAIGMFVAIITIIIVSINKNKQHLADIKNEQSVNVVKDKDDVIVVKDSRNIKVLKKDSYKAVFKEKIIAPILKNINPNFEYTWYKGMDRYEYRKGQWESFDLYDSEDQIIAPISIHGHEEFKAELVISEVHTQNEHTDSDGDTHRTTLFHGLAGYVKLPKDIGTYIKVKRDSLKLFGGSKQRIEMDMSEFEKIFDVETGDKIKTMQILTADVMADMINIIQISKVKFEFYLNHDMMYIRFHTGELFEPSIFGKSMQFDMLKKYCDITENVIKITEDICNKVMSVEV